MKREIFADLVHWKEKDDRQPLLIRGARQVGKTYAAEYFGREYFENVVTINLEQQPEYHSSFTTLYPEEIIKKIQILSQQVITPGKTLLFLDEIQECPNAIVALRYFYEQMPSLHVIAAGSLLEFALRKENLRMPVGRIQSLYMYPLSFKEFLLAKNETFLVDYLTQLKITDSIETAIHEKCISLLKDYWLIGGMPATVRTFLKTNNIRECHLNQSSILDSYRSDFGKYANKTNIRYLQRLFEKTPGLIAKHFKIEVKTGATGRLRSLHLFLDEKKCHWGLRISQKPLEYKKPILSIPLYMLFRLKDFLGELE